MSMTPEQVSAWTKEIRDRERLKNRAFNKFHKDNRRLDREEARRAWDAGYVFRLLEETEVKP